MKEWWTGINNVWDSFVNCAGFLVSWNPTEFEKNFEVSSQWVKIIDWVKIFCWAL